MNKYKYKIFITNQWVVTNLTDFSLKVFKFQMGTENVHYRETSQRRYDSSCGQDIRQDECFCDWNTTKIAKKIF